MATYDVVTCMYSILFMFDYFIYNHMYVYVRYLLNELLTRFSII